MSLNSFFLFKFIINAYYVSRLLQRYHYRLFFQLVIKGWAGSYNIKGSSHSNQKMFCFRTPRIG